MLKRIPRHIMLCSASTSDLGLANGKMGAIIYFYHLAGYTGNRIYSLFAKELLDQLYDIISVHSPMNFADGLAGIAWGIDYLCTNNFLSPDSDDVLEELDDLILKTDLDTMDDNSLMYGLKGYAWYILARCTHPEFTKTQASTRFIRHLLKRFADLKVSDPEEQDLCNYLSGILADKEPVYDLNSFFNRLIDRVAYEDQSIFIPGRPIGILNNGYAVIGLKMIHHNTHEADLHTV